MFTLSLLLKMDLKSWIEEKKISWKRSLIDIKAAAITRVVFTKDWDTTMMKMFFSNSKFFLFAIQLSVVKLSLSLFFSLSISLYHNLSFSLIDRDRADTIITFHPPTTENFLSTQRWLIVKCDTSLESSAQALLISTQKK